MSNQRIGTDMWVWIVIVEVVLGIIIATVIASILYRRLLYPLPEQEPVASTDPYAYEVDHFMRAVSRWEHDQRCQ